MLSKAQKQELANSLTHGIALIASLVGVVLMLGLSLQTQSRLAVGAAALYCFSLVLTYGSSTLYHSILHPGAKKVLQKLDHIAIYFLIGGSYTPLVIHYLDPGIGWPFLALLWSLIAIGVIYKSFWLDKAPVFSLIFYLALGWMVLPVARPLFDNLPLFSSATIVLGGAFYTLGVIFYVWKRFTYHHAIWHLFVIGGSASHYLAILYAMSRWSLG